jgi:hypothetical protein
VQNIALLCAIDSCNGNEAITKGKEEVVEHAVSQIKKATKATRL